MPDTTPHRRLRTHIKKKKPRRRQRGSASPRIFSLAGVVPPVRRIPTVARRVICRRRIIARERADTRSRMGSSPDYNMGSMLQLRPMRALASAPARRLALGWARTHFLKSPLMCRAGPWAPVWRPRRGSGPPPANATLDFRKIGSK